MIAVFGATGQVGGKVAAMLLESGVPVRILIRSEDKAGPLRNEGVEVVAGSLENVDDISNTVIRCDSAFLMTPSNLESDNAFEKEIAIGRNYGEALRNSDVRHVVYMSVIAARENTGTPHFDTKAQVEDSIASAGVDCTFLRPAFFMENFYEQWPLIQQMGIISYPIPADKPLPMVATEDIAYVAVQSLQRGGRGQEAYDLLGPRDYTMAEATQIIGDIIGKSLRYVEASAEQAVDWMASRGMSRTSAQDTVSMFNIYATMQFGDRNKVYEEFNFDPTTLETVMNTAAGALREETHTT